ncbi:MAG: efflux RND transporter periplasmic adaptor subunit [Pseudomonadota bacterium]
MIRLHAAIALSLLLLAACDGAAPTHEEMVRPVRAMQIEAGDALTERRFPGRAQATQEINLAFEVPGQLIERPVVVGDEVNTGHVLARLDPRDYENELDAARAARDRSKANYERMVEAGKTGAVSKQDVDDAAATFQASDARTRIAEKALEDTVIRAKFPGTVAATYVENFQNVQAKQAVLRVLDTSKVEMWINIPENLISFAPYVRDIRVRFDAFPDHQVPAEITEVSNEASLTTRTYPVKLIMDQPDDITILPGMAGQASGRVEQPGETATSGFEVPISALGTSDNDATFVWVIDEASGVAVKRDVEVGRATPRGAVIQGVAVGEWIATAGASTLIEGQKVRLLDLDDESAG